MTNSANKYADNDDDDDDREDLGGDDDEDYDDVCGAGPNKREKN